MNSLRRVLERLRASTKTVLGKRPSTRVGIHEPQRMRPVVAPARSGSRR